MIWLQISLNIIWLNALLYDSGRKLFEESGNITAAKFTRVHPFNVVTTEVSFTSKIRSEGRFSNGENLALGIIIKYPHSIIDVTWQGSVMISEDDGQFMWWGHEKSMVRSKD